MRLSTTSRFVLAAAAAVLVIPAAALAQVQSKEQQACINLLNKGMAKVSAVQAKEAMGCISDFAKGTETDAFNCYDFSPKVETARLAVCTAQSEKCTESPGFGPNNCTNVGAIAEGESAELTEDIFDIPSDQMIASCATDSAKCKCQAKVLKTTYKLLATRLKVFNACKKSGLKNTDAQITSEFALADCRDVDPKEARNKAILKLIDVVTTDCVFPSLFDSGACEGLTSTPLVACLDHLTRCRACNTVRYADNLSITCDDYDDGSFNGSCTTD